MPPLLILFIGMIVVLAGIVFFRWHAFLSLIAAALTIALLTSPTTLMRNEIRRVAITIDAGDLADGTITSEAIQRKELSPGSYQIIRRQSITGEHDSGRIEPAG